ncbi:MAG TPA: hypothetical protein VK145_02055 [Candidatus Nanoarchaeia archaeon]|nr:hypothetical protein [Candidatus Nanoarchaeia archaeon]
MVVLETGVVVEGSVTLKPVVVKVVDGVVFGVVVVEEIVEVEK